MSFAEQYQEAGLSLFCPSCRQLSDGETAIKEEGGTSNKIGSLRGQINGGARTFFGPPKTTGRCPCDYFLVERHCFHGCHHVCVNKSGGDGVTWILNRANSIAIDLVSWTKAPLEAL